MTPVQLLLLCTTRTRLHDMIPHARKPTNIRTPTRDSASEITSVVESTPLLVAVVVDALLQFSMSAGAV